MNLFEQLKSSFPEQIKAPQELEHLCHWVEQNGYPISGDFELRVDDGETINHWFGFNEVSHRFGVFGAGATGDIFAFWVDDNDHQKIVHLGSEGDNMFIIAEDFIDFLRFLAIGYKEISQANMHVSPMEHNIQEALKQFRFVGNTTITEAEIVAEYGDELYEGINNNFQHWVKEAFKVSIPVKGNEIINVNDRTFQDWLEKQYEMYGE
ncbi:hypothetical protein [Paenimyroides aestuarii]|uniref:SMI1/KNR4 family protein n=1 Tax=Paenimyroides aestuarii TaxID=2968490 RepID=A0ABY5NV23_9FLAO|nr:hypothetical protein [Paenimyroides aestuarii]UUV22380.1 hypothetical protein NPX36_04895 [Paenimyroides aestuarii]